MPTAASTGSDINGAAALAACEEIRKRLLAFAAKTLGAPEDELSIGNGLVLRGGRDAGLPWKDLVAKAHEARVDLSAHGFHATPGLSYDMAAERGTPFAYHVYGAALVVAELDAVRGTARIARADLVHDGGVPIDALVDSGQIEGAFAQGLGWAILEDLVYSREGRLLSDTLSTYKLPDMKFMDFPLEVELLGGPNPKAVLGSKAVGEPPFQYGIAGYFAVLEALKAARPRSSGFYDLPLTPEKALAFLDGGA
jgi:xanthine dehydrogenase large subunit